MAENQSRPFDHPRFRSWIAVGRACQTMQSALGRALAPLGLKPPHLDVLVNLYRFEGLTQQDLARKLLVGRSNMSMTLPQLEKRGLIARYGDPGDRRVLRLRLTESGRHTAERAMAIQTALIDAVLSPTPSDHCTIIAETMEAMIQRLQEWEKTL
ncbi:MarR family transcriptional regulator [Rhizobiaceae bacterium BDR2-2]|uniref:MarR family transcriptional regulator n=1 Tax=Ectorhizobium quercum TaxID=2965071 RepID=A0AAE3N3B7_9HYPH|nr:MarR family transcriptional regulator [Ectorhizobium quercum]MCX8999829.1 MarR family transcriptional regulator [Ectorhizobium quercum]